MPSVLSAIVRYGTNCNDEALQIHTLIRLKERSVYKSHQVKANTDSVAGANNNEDYTASPMFCEGFSAIKHP
jgi:hypothetical protein